MNSTPFERPRPPDAPRRSERRSVNRNFTASHGSTLLRVTSGRYPSLSEDFPPLASRPRAARGLRPEPARTAGGAAPARSVPWVRIASLLALAAIILALMTRS